jgi:hypothetical protein
MHCLEFPDDRVERGLAFSGTHDPILVILSICVARLRLMPHSEWRNE